MSRRITATALLVVALLTGCAAAPPVEAGHTTAPTASVSGAPLPDGFVHLADAVPDAIQEIRYASTYNFVGERIDGYEASAAILTAEAAAALREAGDILRTQGYVLKVFDAYRPQRAVDHFVRWAADPGDERMKQAFYPDVDTSRLFADGYIAEHSGHSRGSTVDVTLVGAATGREVWMGTPFDFFGLPSHHGAGDAEGVSADAAANRLILRDAMTAVGFVPLPEEWWHYRLADEPHPETYFDFPVR
ncbi:M15 family metallopeptidase [Microbacterium caowuchunii]|uniref:D-alanyl-D-alanine dipeptidase n=1 Tax=Microbacterium caowuchunii TaxID=2614638 RepID=A0A5N0TER7_9MICO|nr:M15 family metallopeptidase [Microbacterium caowuchunii]KAA9133613.1 M15 family metallopeptidase [Microbacterium caowuchunii]